MSPFRRLPFRRLAFGRLINDYTTPIVRPQFFPLSFCLEFSFRVRVLEAWVDDPTAGGSGGAQPPSLVQTGELSRDNHDNACMNN